MLAIIAIGSMSAACGGGEQVTLKAEPIDQFECRRNGEPVELDRYTARALPGIWRVLADNGRRVCWSEALVVAGHIGGAETYAQLVGFIESRSQSFAMSEDLVYIQTAFQALAEMARSPEKTRNSAQALEYLVESSNPAAWEKRTVNWTLDMIIKRELIRTLTVAAVRALGSVNMRDKADGLYTTPKLAQQTMLDFALTAAARDAYRFKYQDTDAPTDIIGQLINLHVVPPGRVAYAMTEALVRIREREANIGTAVKTKGADLVHLRSPFETKKARDAGPRTTREHGEQQTNLANDITALRGERGHLGSLQDIVETVRNEALDTFEQERAWLAARRGEQEWLRAVADANALADVRLEGLHGQLRSLKDLLDTATEKDAIAMVESVIFPEGPLPLIESPLPEQVKFTLAACDELEAKQKSNLVKLKLVKHVQVTRIAHEALDRALRSGMAGEGYDEVIRARARLQIHLRVLVATIISRYPGFDAVDRKIRDLALEPMLNQDEQVAGYLKRRVSVHDVDPESGQELDPLEEGGAVDKSKDPGIGDAESLRRTLRRSYGTDGK
jgi:hypothetical protein